MCALAAHADAFSRDLMQTSEIKALHKMEVGERKRGFFPEVGRRFLWEAVLVDDNAASSVYLATLSALSKKVPIKGVADEFHCG